MSNQYISEFPKSFWEKVNKTKTCWIWTASKDACGYGLHAKKFNTTRAHRISYILKYGEFDQKLKVLHICDTPECVRPDHLKLGTQQDNMIDMVSKNRHYKQNNLNIDYDEWLKSHHLRSKKDICSRGHKFSNKNTRMKKIKNRYTRVCRQCEFNTSHSDMLLYKIKNFVRHVENRKEIIDGIYNKIKNIGEKCYYCEGKFETFDHKIPKSKGGLLSVDNIFPSCYNCNLKKGGKID